MKEKKRFQAHFRKFHSKKTTGHPQYVYGEDGHEYLVIGITGAQTTNGKANIELDRNPEPENPRKAYIRPKPDKINKGIRNDRLKGWSFAESDKAKVRNVISKKEKSRKK